MISKQMISKQMISKQMIILLLVGITIIYILFSMRGTKNEPFFGNLSDTWNLVPAQSQDYQEMHNYFDESRNVTPDFDTFTCGDGIMAPNNLGDFRMYIRDTIGQVSN